MGYSLRSSFSIFHFPFFIFWVGVGGCAAPSAKVEPVYFPPPPASPHVVHLMSFNSLGDLTPARHSWVEFFRGVAPSPHVRTPAGVAFRDGCLYLCDIGFTVVHRWDLQAGQGAKFGVNSDPALLKPVDVAVDDAGTVYVADTGLAEVIAFDANGAVRRRFKPEDREDYRPVAVAVHGSRLYVADIASTTGHRIDVFSTGDGRLRGSFGGIGGESGRFFFPMGLAVARDGRVYVADRMNSRVQVFNALHEWVLSFGQPGDRYGDMGKPKRVAVGPDGVVFVADVDFAHVHLFDRQGRLLMLLGGPGEGPGSTPLPSGVAVAPTLPARLAALVPDDFQADYFLFVTNSVGDKRISLYAVGTAHRNE